jgi:16S rRNA (guanine527-N7)-methyltransferase
MDLLLIEAKKIGITLTQEQTEQFTSFLNLLQKENEEINLTAITETKDIILKHFVDSISVVPFIPKNALSIIDVGSGAGFPGIPLAIVRPELLVTLLEATTKKVNFLNKVIETLRLKNVKTLNARAEEAGQDLRFREQFDVVLARAVAETKVLAEYTLPFVKIGGFVIAQKDATENIVGAEKAIKTLGGDIQDIVPIKISGLSDRNLVIIRKTSNTIDKYPRRPGSPEKKPIS